MAGKRAAYRYAKALLSLASESNQLDNIHADMRLVDDTITESKELRVLIKSPVIKNEQKRSSLEAVFSEVQPTTQQLFKVLLDNKRIVILPQVAEAFNELVDKLNKVTTAQVTTATDLTPEIEEKVMTKIKEITTDQVSLEKKLDESLIGGFILRIGDIQYDASISGRLNTLKNKFKNSAQV